MADKSRFDVREDEEQGVKFQGIVDLLLAAGYFRARIKGLSPFDKTVGGMTWCIEVCNMDIDVDLLFHENLTIGQKISLTEKIVTALKKMKCPHRLEPHQIQGLDFIHVFPVVQWLVKRAIETREETGDTVRAHSIYQFDQTHRRTPEDFEFEKLLKPAKESACSLKESYSPKRRYRRSDGRRKLDVEELKVQSTLLEYGIGLGSFMSETTEKSKVERRPSRSDDVISMDDVERQHQYKVAMKNMMATQDTEKLAASVVGSIVGLQSDEIKKIASEYAEKQAALANLDGISDADSIDFLQKTGLLSSLTNQTEQLEANVKITEMKNEELRQKHTEHFEKLKKMENQRNQILADLKELESIESEENQEILKKLQSLVALNENLKSQEQTFRAHCKEELCRLQANIDNLKSTDTEDDQESDERSNLIEKHYQADKEKLQKLRLLLARKNREIATLQRKLDEVPTRAELGQYQQRFLELYNQVAAKHKETKQFYTLYNTLDDTKLYLSKEVNLLNSILDNFAEAMQNNHSKQQFLKQFEGIVEGVNQNKIKLDKKKQEEKMKRDQLNDTYLDFVEKQRIYFKTVKDFKEECRKNEILLSKLKDRHQ